MQLLRVRRSSMFLGKSRITMTYNGHLTAWFLWRKSLRSIIRQRNHAVKCRWCQTLDGGQKNNLNFTLLFGDNSWFFLVRLRWNPLKIISAWSFRLSHYSCLSILVFTITRWWIRFVWVNGAEYFDVLFVKFCLAWKIFFIGKFFRNNHGFLSNVEFCWC